MPPDTAADTTSGGVSAGREKRRRRPPSPAEQARRVAWGKEFGPKAAAAIKKAIREAS